MRNVIGFQKPQDPMGLQMVEGLGGGNGAWVYGGERGLREGLGSASHASCPTSLAGPAGLRCHTSVSAMRKRMLLRCHCGLGAAKGFKNAANGLSQRLLGWGGGKDSPSDR